MVSSDASSTWNKIKDTLHADAESPMSMTRASCPLTFVMAPEMKTPLPTSAVTSWALTRPAGPAKERAGEDKGRRGEA